MASPAESRAEVRGVLLRLGLCSTTRARTYVPAVSGSPPSSRPPSGEARPLAELLAADLERAGDDAVKLERVLRHARDELEAIKRRPLAHDGDLVVAAIADGSEERADLLEPPRAGL